MLVNRIKHVKFNLSEIGDIGMISFILSFMFTISYFRFESDSTNSFFHIIILFFVFIAFVISSRLAVMKLVSCYNGFSLNLYQTYFDRYGIKSYDRLSYIKTKAEKRLIKAPLEIGKKINKSIEGLDYYIQPHGGKFSGIPMSIISLMIYIFTLGFLIFPSQWRYKAEKIPHLFIGTVHLEETEMPWIHPMVATGYRLSRVLFSGFFFYLVIAFVMKYILLLDDNQFFGWFYFILFWISIITILPIPGTEGYDLWDYSRFSWLSSITILILGMFAILVFDSFSYAILVSFVAFVIAILTYLWRQII